jgi:hypothetical protein
MGSPRYLERAASVHHLKPDELIGPSWQDLTLIPSREQATQIWQTVLEQKTATHVAELSREIHPGEKMVWNNTFIPIMDDQEPEKVRFVLVSAVDITEQIQMQRELEASGHLKDEFLSRAQVFPSKISPIFLSASIVYTIQNMSSKRAWDWASISLMKLLLGMVDVYGSEALLDRGARFTLLCSCRPYPSNSPRTSRSAMNKARPPGGQSARLSHVLIERY